METFFAYSPVLKKERERRRPSNPSILLVRRHSGTPPPAPLRVDPRPFLRLASVCQTVER
jgi:hypothetical protein